MPRPSVRHQRQEQILDAFERCVARYGLDGASLERVSEEAGLARPLIRHNVGNRDQLVEAFTARFFERSRQANKLLVDALPSSGRATKLVEWLFAPGLTDPKLVQVSAALSMAGATDPALARKVQAWTDAFVELVEGEIRSDLPKVPIDDAEIAALTIVALYFNLESLATLGSATRWRAVSVRAAMEILDRLRREFDEDAPTS